MKKGITFGAFDLFHAGHIMMMEEAKTVCDYLIVGLQTDPSIDRKEKNKPVQSTIERQIQLEGCKFVDEVVIYDTEADLMEILKIIEWDVYVIGEEYKNKFFTARDKYLDKCYFNSRPHNFSTTELRQRVENKQFRSNNS
tara:strand:+ start:1040 stop:1459 length:420 start_codon:yes stop_codon:yes gene_type:complete